MLSSTMLDTPLRISRAVDRVYSPVQELADGLEALDGARQAMDMYSPGVSSFVADTEELSPLLSRLVSGHIGNYSVLEQPVEEQLSAVRTVVDTIDAVVAPTTLSVSSMSRTLVSYMRALAPETRIQILADAEAAALAALEAGAQQLALVLEQFDAAAARAGADDQASTALWDMPEAVVDLEVAGAAAAAFMDDGFSDGPWSGHAAEIADGGSPLADGIAFMQRLIAADTASLLTGDIGLGAGSGDADGLRAAVARLVESQRRAGSAMGTVVEALGASVNAQVAQLGSSTMPHAVEILLRRVQASLEATVEAGAQPLVEALLSLSAAVNNTLEARQVLIMPPLQHGALVLASDGSIDVSATSAVPPTKVAVDAATGSAPRALSRALVEASERLSSDTAPLFLGRVDEASQVVLGWVMDLMPHVDRGSVFGPQDDTFGEEARHVIANVSAQALAVAAANTTAGVPVEAASWVDAVDLLTLLGNATTAAAAHNRLEDIGSALAEAVGATSLRTLITSMEFGLEALRVEIGELEQAAEPVPAALTDANTRVVEFLAALNVLQRFVLEAGVFETWLSAVQVQGAAAELETASVHILDEGVRLLSGVRTVDEWDLDPYFAGGLAGLREGMSLANLTHVTNLCTAVSRVSHHLAAVLVAAGVAPDADPLATAATEGGLQQSLSLNTAAVWSVLRLGPESILSRHMDVQLLANVTSGVLQMLAPPLEAAQDALAHSDVASVMMQRDAAGHLLLHTLRSATHSCLKTAGAAATPATKQRLRDLYAAAFMAAAEADAGASALLPTTTRALLLSVGPVLDDESVATWLRSISVATCVTALDTAAIVVPQAVRLAAALAHDIHAPVARLGLAGDVADLMTAVGDAATPTGEVVDLAAEVLARQVGVATGPPALAADWFAHNRSLLATTANAVATATAAIQQHLQARDAETARIEPVHVDTQAALECFASMAATVEASLPATAADDLLGVEVEAQLALVAALHTAQEQLSGCLAATKLEPILAPAPPEGEEVTTINGYGAAREGDEVPAFVCAAYVWYETVPGQVCEMQVSPGFVAPELTYERNCSGVANPLPDESNCALVEVPQEVPMEEVCEAGYVEEERVDIDCSVYLSLTDLADLVDGASALPSDVALLARLAQRVHAAAVATVRAAPLLPLERAVASAQQVQRMVGVATSALESPPPRPAALMLVEDVRTTAALSSRAARHRVVAALYRRGPRWLQPVRDAALSMATAGGAVSAGNATASLGSTGVAAVEAARVAAAAVATTLAPFLAGNDGPLLALLDTGDVGIDDVLTSLHDAAVEVASLLRLSPINGSVPVDVAMALAAASRFDRLLGIMGGRRVIDDLDLPERWAMVVDFAADRACLSTAHNLGALLVSTVEGAVKPLDGDLPLITRITWLEEELLVAAQCVEDTAAVPTPDVRAGARVLLALAKPLVELRVLAARKAPLSEVAAAAMDVATTVGDTTRWLLRHVDTTGFEALRDAAASGITALTQAVNDADARVGPDSCLSDQPGAESPVITAVAYAVGALRALQPLLSDANLQALDAGTVSPLVAMDLAHYLSHAVAGLSEVMEVAAGAAAAGGVLSEARDASPVEPLVDVAASVQASVNASIERLPFVAVGDSAFLGAALLEVTQAHRAAVLRDAVLTKVHESVQLVNDSWWMHVDGVVTASDVVQMAVDTASTLQSVADTLDSLASPLGVHTLHALCMDAVAQLSTSGLTQTVASLTASMLAIEAWQLGAAVSGSPSDASMWPPQPDQAALVQATALVTDTARQLASLAPEHERLAAGLLGHAQQLHASLELQLHASSAARMAHTNVRIAQRLLSAHSVVSAAAASSTEATLVLTNSPTSTEQSDALDALDAAVAAVRGAAHAVLDEAIAAAEETLSASGTAQLAHLACTARSVRQATPGLPTPAPGAEEDDPDAAANALEDELATHADWCRALATEAGGVSPPHCCDTLLAQGWQAAAIGCEPLPDCFALAAAGAGFSLPPSCCSQLWQAGLAHKTCPQPAVSCSSLVDWSADGGPTLYSDAIVPEHCCLDPSTKLELATHAVCQALQQAAAASSEQECGLDCIRCELSRLHVNEWRDHDVDCVAPGNAAVDNTTDFYKDCIAGANAETGAVPLAARRTAVHDALQSLAAAADTVMMQAAASADPEPVAAFIAAGAAAAGSLRRHGGPIVQSLCLSEAGYGTWVSNVAALSPELLDYVATAAQQGLFMSAAEAAGSVWNGHIASKENADQIYAGIGLVWDAASALAQGQSLPDTLLPLQAPAHAVSCSGSDQSGEEDLAQQHPLHMCSSRAQYAALGSALGSTVPAVAEDAAATLVGAAQEYGRASSHAAALVRGTREAVSLSSSASLATALQTLAAVDEHTHYAGDELRALVAPSALHAAIVAGGALYATLDRDAQTAPGIPNATLGLLKADTGATPAALGGEPSAQLPVEAASTLSAAFVADCRAVAGSLGGVGTLPGAAAQLHALLAPLREDASLSLAAIGDARLASLEQQLVTVLAGLDAIPALVRSHRRIPSLASRTFDQHQRWVASLLDLVRLARVAGVHHAATSLAAVRTIIDTLQQSVTSEAGVLGDARDVTNADGWFDFGTLTLQQSLEEGLLAAATAVGPYADAAAAVAAGNYAVADALFVFETAERSAMAWLWRTAQQASWSTAAIGSAKAACVTACPSVAQREVFDTLHSRTAAAEAAVHTTLGLLIQAAANGDSMSITLDAVLPSTAAMHQTIANALSLWTAMSGANSAATSALQSLGVLEDVEAAMAELSDAATSLGGGASAGVLESVTALARVRASLVVATVAEPVTQGTFDDIEPVPFACLDVVDANPGQLIAASAATLAPAVLAALDGESGDAVEAVVATLEAVAGASTAAVGESASTAWLRALVVDSFSALSDVATNSDAEAALSELQVWAALALAQRTCSDAQGAVETSHAFAPLGQPVADFAAAGDSFDFENTRDLGPSVSSAVMEARTTRMIQLVDYWVAHGRTPLVDAVVAARTLVSDFASSPLIDAATCTATTVDAGTVSCVFFGCMRLEHNSPPKLLHVLLRPPHTHTHTVSTCCHQCCGGPGDSGAAVCACSRNRQCHPRCPPTSVATQR